MKVCHHRKSEEDSPASASFADRQLEYDTLKILQLKVIMSLLASFQRGMERAFAMLFSRSFLIACINCKEIAAVAYMSESCRFVGGGATSLDKKKIHPDRACYLAAGLPVESGTSFLRSLDDFEMSLAQPMQ